MATDVRTLYTPHTVPFEHQWECLQASYNKRAFAILMDPGLGKTKVIWDTAAILFLRGHIRGLLVCAPNDVHAQWVEEQMPIHLPPHVRTRTAIWDAKSVRAVRLCNELVSKPLPDRLAVLCVNHEALATKRGRELVRKFLRTYAALFVLDESHDYKTPKAQRTRAVQALKHLAFARRILTGTLSDGTPFALFSQFNFLDDRILNCDSYLAFKHRYATWITEFKDTGKKDRHGKRILQPYETLQEYQQLDDLNRRIAPFVYSKKKEDCKDLPPKMYTVVPTHLSVEQRSVYDSLLDAGIALLQRAEQGKSVEAADLGLIEEHDLVERVATATNRMTFQIKLTLLLRLQQCVAGFTTDDAKVTRPIHDDWKDLPRMQALIAYVERCLAARGKVIIWAQSRVVVEAIAAVMATLPGANPLMVHGGVQGEARKDAIAYFKDPASKWRVLAAHPRTLGTGQNFEVASTVLFYQRSFSLIQRKQAEDRAHRLSSRGTVTVADLVARGARTDAREMESLKLKQDMAKRIETFKARDLREMLAC